jgi:clusterin-associated protein 1
MDKYDVLQKELDDLFVIYSKKSRNFQWLQSQMEAHNQEEQEKLDEADCCMRRLQRQLHEEVQRDIHFITCFSSNTEFAITLLIRSV